MKITDESLLSYMLEVSEEAAKELFSMHLGTPKSRLIIPHKRDDSYRLSEQELRIACINAIQSEKRNSDLHFSVETPTSERHLIKGKQSSRSALFDLSLYETSDYKSKICNLELKAHNTVRPENISKDLYKLIKENQVGAFFQVLTNTNSKTFQKLFDKFSTSLESILKVNKLIPKFPILITIFVLEKGQFIYQVLYPDQLQQPSQSFVIDYNSLEKAKKGVCKIGLWNVLIIDKDSIWLEHQLNYQQCLSNDG